MTTQRSAALAVVLAGVFFAAAGCGKKPSSDDSNSRGSAPAKSDDKPGDKGGSKGGNTASDIPECAAHLKRMADCGEGDSLVTKRRDEIQKRLDKGTSASIMAASCKTMDNVYKCKGGSSAADPTASDPPKKDDKGSSADDELGVKVCDDYVKTVKACPSIKSTKPLDTLVEKWKKSLGDGKRKDVEEACEKATKLFKCKG